jgi:VanZ family protein
LAVWRISLGLYFVTMTVLTHLPRMEPLGPGHDAPDKLAHFLTFGGLAVLLERSRLAPRGWIAFALIALWAPVDEWTQQWFSVSRTTSVADVVGGWMGIASAGVVTAALRPTKRASGAWRRGIATLDAMVEPGTGGMLAAIVALLITAAAFPIIFGLTWTAAGVSLPNAAAMLSIAAGLLGAAPLTRRAWRNAGGASWPAPPAWTWVLLPVAATAGWLGGEVLATIDVAGLGTAGALMGGVIWCGVAAGLGWRRVGVVNG